MAQGIKVTVKPTWRDLQGRFAKAEKALIEARRDELRGEGRHIVDLIVRRLRQKVDGPSKIEKGIRFNTRVSGDAVRLSVTAPDRARPHPIRAKNAKALSFFWPKVGMQTVVPRRGGFRTHVAGGTLWVGKGQVDHPGGTLVPLLQPIIKSAGDDWLQQRGKAALNRMASRYTAEIAGGD